MFVANDATQEKNMTITTKNADRIINNATLCASIRKLAKDYTESQLANELRRTAAKRGISMSLNEAIGLVDAIVGDVQAA